jgi:hypothetical protein
MYQALLRDAAEAREAHQRGNLLHAQRNAGTAVATSSEAHTASVELENARRMTASLEKVAFVHARVGWGANDSNIARH